MNLGQTLLTLAAMMILTQLAVRVNSNVLQTQEVMQNSKFGLVAASLATSTIEEANKLAFDAKTVDDAVTSVNQLTASNLLGPESGETKLADFNDFDDFNGYKYFDTTLSSAHFNISCLVQYVDPPNLNSYTLTRSYHKKLTVFVSSKSMQDTVKVSTVFSYWKYR